MKKAAVLVLLVSLVACGRDEPAGRVATSPSPEPATASPTPSPTSLLTPSPSPQVEFLCPNEEVARANEQLRNGGTLEGDVDGDGNADEVWVAIDPDATSTPCSAFIIVRTADGRVLSTPLSFQEFSGPGFPKLHGLIDVTLVEGYEIVVDVIAGASTQFLAMYGVSGNRILQIQPRGVKEAEGGLFGYGGSVGHVDAIDCIEGHIIVSTAVPSGEGVEYEVTRRDLEPQGLVLVPRGKPQKDRVDLDRLSDYPEFASSPLGSCPRI